MFDVLGEIGAASQVIHEGFPIGGFSIKVRLAPSAKIWKFIYKGCINFRRVQAAAKSNFTRHDG